MTIMDNLFGNKKKLIQENKVLKQEVENLHKEIDSLNSKYENIRKIRANENTAASFCNWSYINYYFRDDFEEKFMEMVENLPKESKNYFKWLFLRSLAINYNRRETLFFLIISLNIISTQKFIYLILIYLIINLNSIYRLLKSCQKLKFL